MCSRVFVIFKVAKLNFFAYKILINSVLLIRHVVLYYCKVQLMYKNSYNNCTSGENNYSITICRLSNKKNFPCANQNFNYFLGMRTFRGNQRHLVSLHHLIKICNILRSFCYICTFARSPSCGKQSEPC